MIENRRFQFKKVDMIGVKSIAEVIEGWVGDKALRWYISQVTDEEVVIEATMVSEGLREHAGDVLDRFYPGKSAAVAIVPTGVGCELGGYAGDAAPAAHVLAAAVDYLVTNPNSVNASNFIHLEDHLLYTEGLCIDLLMKGAVDLYVPRANRVGLIIEQASQEALDGVFNVINTARAVYGVDIVDYVITERPIGSRCVENESGAYVGTVDNPEVIFDACDRLLAQGAQAIAITTNIQDLPHDEYVKHFEGQYPNPMGGVEAIMSHLIVNRYRVPSAHAPMVNTKELALSHGVVDARGAGEMSSFSGLACVLIGLSRAPQLTRERGGRFTDALNVNNLLAVVAPADCLGGIPAIYAHKHQIPIIAVEDNRTVMGVTQEKIGLDNVLHARSYAEAAGLLLALRHGIAPGSFTRPLPTMRYRKSELYLNEVDRPARISA